MPKVSRESASQVRDFKLAEDRTEELDGYSVSFVSIRETHDLAALLKGLPGDSCQCPHWGYVFKGKLTWRFADHEEVCEAGDAYYVPPGHVPEAEAGSEFVQFSPSDVLHTTEAAMMENMNRMQEGQ
jgi:mannose-6-phosphate isomerase-like protein (cupin superfamily)